MTTKPPDLITVGRITGVFGIKGWLKVKSWTEPEEQIVNYAPWWLKARQGVRKVVVDDHVLRPQGLLVHLEGLDDRDQAMDIGKVAIAIEKQLLPRLEEGDYYWHQLEGLQVVSRYKGVEYALGCVDKLLETGANDVLVVKPSAHSVDDRERLVPYVPDVYVKEVNMESQKIVVEWDPDF